MAIISSFNATQVIISAVSSVRNELENSRLGLNQSLVLIVLLSLTPVFFLRWLSTRYSPGCLSCQAVTTGLWFFTGRSGFAHDGVQWHYGRTVLPPAPPGWPLIGHLHLLGTHAHQSMAALSAKYAPQGIMYMKFGLKGGIIVSNPEMAKEIFRKHDVAFAQRPQLIVTDLLVAIKEGVAFQPNNAAWRTLRKIFTQEVLSPKRMQLAERIRASEMDYMVNSIFNDVTRNPNTLIEVNEKFWVFTTNFISRMVLSKRYFSNDSEGEISQEAAEWKDVMLELFSLVGSIFPADSLPFLRPFDIGGLEKRIKAILPRFQRILTKILTERREMRNQEGDAYVDVDMVDVLLTKQEKGEISEDNVGGVIWDAFAGGTDTQITIVEWAMAHIIADPQVYETLRAELDREVGVERRVVESDLSRLRYVNAVMKETFRLHPPTPLLLPHMTTDACTVAGYYVPPNTRLFVNVWAMGRDPRVWENPSEFRPERFLQEDLKTVDVHGQHFNLIPFGAGRRMCPTVEIGVTGVQLGVASLVQGFDWSLPEGVKAADMDMTERPALTIPLATPLRVLAQSRLEAHLYAI